MVKVSQVIREERFENPSEGIFVFPEETKHAAEDGSIPEAPSDTGRGLFIVDTKHCTGNENRSDIIA